MGKDIGTDSIRRAHAIGKACEEAKFDAPLTCGSYAMTRSGASFVLAVEDRGGMGPRTSVHFNIPGPQ